MAKSLGAQLAKLIGNHTAAQIELSLKGTRPAEEQHELHYQAGKAILELYNFCRDELGISLHGEQYMTPTNLTSHVSIDPEHGAIVTMQIDDLSGQIVFYFNHGVAVQATATKDHCGIVRSHEFVCTGNSGELSTHNVMGCLVDISVKTEIPYDMIKAMLLCTHNSKKSMSLTVINLLKG